MVGEWELALRDGKDSGRNIGGTTAEDYIHSLHTNTQDWWKRPANEVTPGDVRILYEAITGAGGSKSQLDKLRSAINGLFSWAIETRKLLGISQSPAFGISTKRGRDEEKRPEILNIAQIQKLLALAKAYAHPWYSIWAFALLSGMRSGELHALTWEEVDDVSGLIHVHRSYNKRKGMVGPTKGRYWRDVPFNDDIKALILSLRAESRGRVHVLPRFRDWDKGEQARILREFTSSCGLPSIRFHTLRSCFATQLLAGNVPIPRVMQIGGWKSLKTVQRYIRIAGVEIIGATDSLQFLPPSDCAGKVVRLIKE